MFQPNLAAGRQLTFVAVLTALVVLVESQVQSVAAVRGFVSSLFVPVQSVARMPVSLIESFSEQAQSDRVLQDEIARLSMQNQLLQARQQRLQSRESENDELRRLLEATRRSDDQFVHAEVLGHSIDPFIHRVTVNRGFAAKASSGQAVMDQHGLLGQVVEVGSLSSDVLLVTDASHQVPVKLHRTGLNGVVRGTGSSDRLVMIDVPITADVRVGDLLNTSGLGQRFPSGYPVATVVSVDRVPGRPFAEIIAKPVAQTDRVSSVMLVYRAQSARDRALAALEGLPGDS